MGLPLVAITWTPAILFGPLEDRHTQMLVLDHAFASCKLNPPCCSELALAAPGISFPAGQGGAYGPNGWCWTSKAR